MRITKKWLLKRAILAAARRQDIDDECRNPSRPESRDALAGAEPGTALGPGDSEASGVRCLREVQSGQGLAEGVGTADAQGNGASAPSLRQKDVPVGRRRKRKAPAH